MAKDYPQDGRAPEGVCDDCWVDATNNRAEFELRTGTSPLHSRYYLCRLHIKARVNNDLWNGDQWFEVIPLHTV